MVAEQLRNYEVSIWTLQDSFITVLKPLNLEFKGVIQDGKITLQDDGVNNISFSIPMYIMNNGQKIENPLWHNKLDGNLIANLRKIKVIFNKFTSDERIFEFIITDVNDSHNGFTKICQVSGDGLAFNELGKQGYKINLSADDLYNEAADLAEEGSSAIINNNINYWIDKVLEGSNWHYSIQMDWSAFDGIVDYTAKEYENLSKTVRDERNNARAGLGLRRRDTIYEDAYVSSWYEENNKIIPGTIQGESEKLRIVEGSESNRYNLLQNIAEVFGVYTKYKYYYDDNYHIIDREVIFYNNFLNEDDIIDLTYKYDTQNLSRNLDANDVVTKMFVKTLNDGSSPSGLISITDTSANKTGEDYILNFDYLHDINTISEEQYSAIKEFEDKIGILNKQIIPLDAEIIALEEELLDCEVKRDNADLEIQQADKNISDIQEFLDNVMDGKENLEVIDSNPAHIILIRNEDSTYIGRFETQYTGVIKDTIRVYRTYASNSPLSDEIIHFGQNQDDNGAKTVKSLSFASDIFSEQFPEQDYFYATFFYRPTIEKETIQKNYQILANRQREIYSNMVKKIDGTNLLATSGTKEELGLTKYIAQRKAERNTLYAQKKQLISSFENLMGPALREGNWQPEDDYTSYGEMHEEIYQPVLNSTALTGTSGILKFIWDNDLFEDEDRNYYEKGILQQKVYYPCIDLTKLHVNIFEKLQNKEFLGALNFTYKNTNSPHAQLNILPIGSCCQLEFVRANNSTKIIPVLMVTDITDVEDIVDEASATRALNKIKEFANACISYVSVDNLLTSNPIIDNETIFSVPADSWLNNPHLYNIVYPRFEVNSEYLKTGTNELMISIYREDSSAANTVITYLVNLEEYNNYYILKKNAKTYITLKPESLFLGKVGEAKVKINFSISNTALQIYLDGISVMKENAYPKVSYSLSNLTSKKLIYNTYDRLGQLAHINDYELKLNNVMGYISAVELNLDNPWEDSITIQNYKNKFEDLFSNIVAQTESMQSNSYKIGVALNSFSSDGKLTCELDDLSLLSSSEVLNKLIKNNADVIAAKTTSTVAKDKAILASTDIYRVMHGEVGLQFQGNAIKAVTLNKDKGLLIEGYDPSIVTNSAGNKTPVFFNVTNNQMGFYRGEYNTFANDCDNYNNNPTNFIANKGYIPEPLLAFKDGDLALSGKLYAKDGWFGGENGWIIGQGLLDDNSSSIITKINNGSSNSSIQATAEKLGGLLYSANGRAIFTSGNGTYAPMIVLSKHGFTNDTNDAVFLFDGSNLYISGHITAAEGTIGGWSIGLDYIGNATSLNNSRIGMRYTTNQDTTKVFWAGGQYNATPTFSVTASGYLTSTSGKIANWKISSNQLNSDTTTNSAYIALNSDTSNSYAIWAGHVTASSAPFSITKAGALKATSADVTGAIKATSGTIGQTSAPKITIGSSANNSSANSYVYSGSKSGKTSNNSGFYLGTDGLALGTTTTINNTTVSKFQVNIDGTMYATGARVSGDIIANSLSTGNHTSSAAADGTYIDSDGAIYGGQNNFKVTKAGKVTATDADITGKITATSGTIGASNGDKITIGGIKDSSQNRAYIYSGSKSFANSTAAGFYIGSDGISFGAYSSGHSPFEVTTSGAVTASNMTITGGSLTIGGTFSVTQGGVLNATGATISGTLTAGANSVIGGWVLSANRLYSGSGTGYVGLDSNTGNTFAIWAGLEAPTTSSYKFAVTRSGTLYATGATISGTLTATTGLIGSTTANQITLGDGIIRWGRTSTADTDDNAGFYLSKDGLYIGNKNKFKVTSAGALTATNATISGTITATSGTIGDCSIENNVLKIKSGNIESLDCGKLNGGTITGQNISGGTISGTTISGSTITSSTSNTQVTISNGCITLDGNWTSSGDGEQFGFDISFNAMKFLFDSNYFYMKNDGVTVIQVPVYSSIYEIPDFDESVIGATLDLSSEYDSYDCHNMNAPNNNINLNNLPHFKGYADNSKCANIANYANKVYSNSGKGTQVIAIGTSNWANTGIYTGNGNGNGSNGTANLIFSSWYGIGFRNGHSNDENYDSITAGINCRNGAFYGSSFNNTSSYLVKENINTISNDLAKKLLLTRPVTFDYKKNKGGLKNQFGLIAEELEEIIPELVNQPETENDYKSIDYSKFVPLLIKLAQNQQDEINNLKEQLQKLK